ncbi:unnamed protein product [Calicophoron daubneyi]|uniref:WD repeat-containing protein 19 n=1 Tax=Calicophoron daubneyi TaxID=300641 RepID=A0AAV2TDR8_CALDB
MKKLFSTDIGQYQGNQSVFKLQSSKSNYIAAFGHEQTVSVFDRHGERKIQLPLPGEPIEMVWDADGDNLAIIDDKTPSVCLWDSLSFKITQLSTGLKDHLSTISWSRIGCRLAIGSEKGNLVLYNHKNSKKVSLLGKHTRRINCVAWSKGNLLALAGDDRVVSINSADGDLLNQSSLRDVPSQLQFADMKKEDGMKGCENTVSCTVGSKNLYILNLDDMENPIELAFQSRYGDIAAYRWFGDGYIMVGFTAGYFIVVSTHKSEIGKEIYQVRDHKDGLCDIAVSPILNRCATAGDHCVKIHDLLNVRELTAIIELEEECRPDEEGGEEHLRRAQANCQLQWSDDGQLMAVVTPRQLLHVFLSQLPMLAAVALPGTTGLSARLTSLLEVTVEALPYSKGTNVPRLFQTPQTFIAEVEPTFIGLGVRYLGVGMNNHAWFYELTDTGFDRLAEYDYLTSVDKISVGENYAATCGPSGQLTLHWIDPKTLPTRDPVAVNPIRGAGCALGENVTILESRERRIFPDHSDSSAKVTSFQLTRDFLIFSTNTGKLVHFHLEEWAYLNEYHHSCGIESVFPNPTGTRVVFIDDRGMAFIYNPVLDYLVELPEFSPSVNRILWDLEGTENPLLVAFDTSRIIVYRYFNHGRLLSSSVRVRSSSMTSHTARGDHESNYSPRDDKDHVVPNGPLEIISGQCRTVGVTRLPYGHLPLTICGGEVCTLTPTGRLTRQTLATHAFRAYSEPLLRKENEKAMEMTTTQMSSQLADTIAADGQTIDQRAEERKAGGEGRKAFKKEKTTSNGPKDPSDLQNYFDQAMRAGCFEDAWVFADQLDNQRLWNQLGMACLRVLQFDIAIRAFRRNNHPGLVLAVQRIQNIEDEYLLAGYVAMLLKEFDHAQELFLASSKPTAALEMRRDLLHWDAALQLARTLAPEEIPSICREYAVEMECVGDYVNALMHYERALGHSESDASDSLLFGQLHELGDSSPENGDLRKTGDILMNAELGMKTGQTSTKTASMCGETTLKEHIDLCNAGIARNAIRLGDLKRGVQLAKDSGNPVLQKECADILEQAKQWQEAATLYELAGCYEASVTVYLRCKNYKRAGELLARVVNAPRLHLQYAKAREADGAFKEAVVAYEAAHDWDSVVRLQLDKLGNPDEAVRVVRETKSIEGAKMIAQYFTRINDHASAIQFLVLSKCSEAAFQLARKYHKMELYADVIGPDADSSEYQSIACYFENEKNWYMAGKFYLLAKQYEKAVRHLLRAPYSEDSPALDLALEAVGMAGDARLTHLLIVYLMGEADGVPKDARHLFRLYMVLEQYKEAARTAVIIAREEQTAGNYRSAHDLLYSMVQELRQRNLRVPAEMTDNLGLLHSYILAKVHVKHGDHLRASRMLIRVAENISKFPAHIVPILTSTVIECQKAGLKSASFSYAAMLLRPEYRDKLDPKYRRKFETLVRRPDRRPAAPDDGQEDAKNPEIEPNSPCPSCSSPLLASSLYCTECRSTLPYCIITGNHVIRNDFTVCPKCQFPAIYSELMSFLERKDDTICPMCSAPFERDAIRRIMDPTKMLNAWITAAGENEEAQHEAQRNAPV